MREVCLQLIRACDRSFVIGHRFVEVIGHRSSSTMTGVQTCVFVCFFSVVYKNYAEPEAADSENSHIVNMRMCYLYHVRASDTCVRSNGANRAKKMCYRHRETIVWTNILLFE